MKYILPKINIDVHIFISLTKFIAYIYKIISWKHL